MGPVDGGEAGLTIAEADSAKVRIEIEGHKKTLDGQKHVPPSKAQTERNFHLTPAALGLAAADSDWEHRNGCDRTSCGRADAP
jgi:hypothetical protein